MSAGNKEKASDGSLESEVEDEDEGRDEESKDVTESPGAMSPENSATIANLMKAETGDGGEDIELENLDTEKSCLESRESNETVMNPSQEENSEAGSKVENGKLKNVVDIESQEPRVTQQEESFRFSAAVSSIWIPSVVGDQKKKFFLKAG